MVTKKDIQATCDDIVREFAPLQVILFGSHAYGTPTEDSDVDLLVVMDIPESETTRQAGEIWQRIPQSNQYLFSCLLEFFHTILQPILILLFQLFKVGRILYVNDVRCY